MGSRGRSKNSDITSLARLRAGFSVLTHRSRLGLSGSLASPTSWGICVGEGMVASSGQMMTQRGSNHRGSLVLEVNGTEGDTLALRPYWKVGRLSCEMRIEKRAPHREHCDGPGASHTLGAAGWFLLLGPHCQHHILLLPPDDGVGEEGRRMFLM